MKHMNAKGWTHIADKLAGKFSTTEVDVLICNSASSENKEG